MTSDSSTINYGALSIVDGLQEPPELYVPGFFAKTNLPEELAQSQDVLDFLRLGVTQWSRIAAWTWCDEYYAFDGTSLKDKDGKTLKDKEIQLKNSLISQLTKQSSCADGYLNYGDNNSNSAADEQSKEIVNALSTYAKLITYSVPKLSRTFLR